MEMKKKIDTGGDDAKPLKGPKNEKDIKFRHVEMGEVWLSRPA